MEVIYFGNRSKKYRDKVSSGASFLALFDDSWDDYSYKTTFNAVAFLDGKEVYLPRIKILFDDFYSTKKYLSNLKEKGWDGSFPVKGERYVSLPVSMDFYELIIGSSKVGVAKKCAEFLHDASYKVFIDEDSDTIKLTQGNGFSDSLLRDRSASTVLKDGWKLFAGKKISISSFGFEFEDRGAKKEIFYNFNDNVLPSDINILVGPNGSGKSQALRKMVNVWLDPKYPDSGKYSEEINVNNLIVVSFSPFELFPVDLKGFDNVSDKGVYSYYGLRRRRKSVDESKYLINLSRNYPKINASKSVIKCIEDDEKFSLISGWSNKVSTMFRVLSKAIRFDSIAVEIDKKVSAGDLYSDLYYTSPVFEYKNKRFLAIEEKSEGLNFFSIKEHMKPGSGVLFFKNGKLVDLSSGQRLFSYMVINILGSIKKNSLIVIDEPELFLHPTLEIEFISMLKEILKSYFSKAILATHSLVVVRETPRKCVHVFKEEKGEVYINNPPFETFGGDVQRISSYVFGDKSISKPYEEWVISKLKEYGSAEKLISELKDDINEELLVYINAMGKKKWS